ncbi:STAS domain-containing protein [Pontibacter pamirensis]|uniref:STAS domain-containing protein n=1 Tax=Pontibacter pamirensis TaxID=2562824 RepID=UPI001389E183|nr:STAS domain-containing protein [Pontibacter pamirensis]
MNNTKHRFISDFTPVENGIILSIKGELDASSSLMAINIMESMVLSGAGNLILDCSQLSYISSAGIGVILSVYHLSLEKHTILTLFGLQPQIKELFEALGIDNLLRITSTKEEAMIPTAVASRLA